MTTSATSIPLYDPRTGEQAGQIVPPSHEEVAEAARVLREGQTKWAALGLQGRISAMRRWADAIEAAAERPRRTLMTGAAEFRNPPSTRAPQVMRTSIARMEYEHHE